MMRRGVIGALDKSLMLSFSRWTVLGIIEAAYSKQNYHRTHHVGFRHPAKFVPVSDEDGILSVEGAQWFVSLLQHVPDLEIDEELCQEDWGVVVFVRRNQKKFWIGLSMGIEGEGMWLAHCHHGVSAWLQRITSTGKKELRHLVSDLHAALTSEPAIMNVIWYDEREMRKPRPNGYTTPFEG